MLRPLIQPLLKQVLAQRVSPSLSVLATGGLKRGQIAIPEGATLYAPLASNTTDALGAVDTFARASDGLYLDSGGTWRVAGTDVPRFESGKLLKEQAVTNKCVNYNDGSEIFGISKAGNTGAVLQKVSDAEASALFGNILSDDTVLEVDTTNGLGFVNLNFGGNAGNTNVHTVSMWIKVIRDGDFAATLRETGAQMTPLPATSTAWTRYDNTGNVVAGSAVQLRVENDGIVRFVLNQFEEDAVCSSPIVVVGASASRAADSLSWAGASGFFNQAQGMAIMSFAPRYSQADLAAVLQGILTLDSASSSNLLYVDGSFRSNDGVNAALVATPAFAPDDVLRLAVLYGPVGASALQVGYSWNGGSWVWSTVTAYDGDYTLVSDLILARAITLPGRYSGVTIFEENRGTAWVEANYP